MINIKNKKTKLKNYNYAQDIKNRIFLSQMGEMDLTVLEEILFSPIQFSMRKMAKNLNLEDTILLNILQKFEGVGLIKIEADCLKVDRESRKYFAVELEKFEKNQTPGVEFIQNMLKKVPKTKGDVLESLIENYLYTPEIFQHHMMDVYGESPKAFSIATEVFSSSELEVSSEYLLEKFQISHDQFQEHMLFLESHFVCCLRYQKVDNRWKEKVTPFREWKEFLLFLKKASPHSIQNTVGIEQFRSGKFFFIDDMASILTKIAQGSFCIEENKESSCLDHVLYKLDLLQFTKTIEGELKITDFGLQWLSLNVEEKALFCYRHVNNRLYSMPNVSHTLIRQAEKALLPIVHKGWIFFEDFFKGVAVPLGDLPPVALRKEGGFWKYTEPYYSTEEKRLLYCIIHEWMLEIGGVVIGRYDGKECFRITDFGKSLFDVG